MIRTFALYRRKSTLQYIYKPLEHRNIRLIYLQPGAKDDPLNAFIMPISLDQASGTFEAISYAWEGSSKYYDLITDAGIVLLTKSLYFALKRFRQKDEIRVLWADAVCINQEDDLEKGKQVGIMSDIYSLATRTLVYLGEASDNSEMAINLLEEIADTGKDRDALTLGLPPDRDPSWKALRIFWGRPWFRRVWVIQEFVRSLDVLMVCGTWEGNWMTFYVATQKLDLFLCGSPTIFNAFEYMAMEAGVSAMALMADIRSHCIGMTLQSTAPNDIMHGVASWPETMSPMHQSWLNDHRKSSPLFRLGGGFSLLELLSCCVRSDSTRARDHLFAVLGLANDAEDEQFRPDYTVPFEEVVRRYGKAFVRNGKCMELLYQCRLGSQSWRFPSWIPDWTTKYVVLNADAVRASLGSSKLYCAAGDSQCQARIDDIEDALIVKGEFTDTVIWTGNGTIRTSLFQVHGNLWALHAIREAQMAITQFTHLPGYPTGEPLHEVLWRTLIANQTHEGLKASDSFGDMLSLLLWRIDKFSDDLKSLSPQVALTWLKRCVGEEYYESLVTRLPAYRLAVTKNSYFGLVPLLTEVGDRICILNGGAAPFVLMERKRPETGYRLIGECYIHGIMNGEAFRTNCWKEQDISIY
ncbi:heterokaryon incompatibility protein-domain-containing protein [Bisporella sp. PMI_857]|nr:heterokaryon incompatibility protein-domain-containing protein [Bisporella sp. PMI_857]